MIKDEELLKQNLQQVDKWPDVLEDNLKDEHKVVFNQRKRAIKDYLESDKKLTTICSEHGLVKSNFYRLLHRCLQIHPDGSPYGFRALIPYYRVKAEKLNKFQALIAKYPALKETLENDYYNRRKKNELKEFNMSYKIIHQRFIQKCISIGIDLNEYPLNTKSKAKKSVERYLNSLADKHFVSSAARHGNDAEMKAKNTGGVYTENNLNTSIRPFERVEFDGHKIDASIALIYTTPEGDEVIEAINRIWILSIIDVATRSILGYHLCLNQEYSSDDVLMCIRNAIKPWKPKQLTIPDLNYSKDAGFPSYLISEVQYGIWDEFCYDNAKANLANIVQENLKEFIGCSINIGPVATPVRRPFIERFFKTLELNGFQRLVSTTGNSLKDPRRRKNSEQIAVDYEIHVGHIEEITDILIAEYNNTPHTSLNGLTPLQVMQQRINKGIYVTTLPIEKRDEFLFFTMKVNRVIRGDISKGIRPFINFEGARYVSDILVNTYSLVGKKITLIINVDDIRFVKAFLEDGSELGILTATGKWGFNHHGLRERKAINRLKNSGEIHIPVGEDPIEIYHRYLKTNATNKKSRNKLASFEKNQDSKKVRYKENNSNQIKQDETVEKRHEIVKKQHPQIDNEKPINKLRRTIQL